MRGQPIETIASGDLVAKIYPDEIHESCRSWDNVTVMALFHNRYDLGDKVDFKSSDFAGWDAMEKHIRKVYKPVALKPVYMYSHSGITISTTPFSCPWDSGRIGFVFVPAATAKKEYHGYTKVETVEWANKTIDGDIETYDAELRGDVFYVEVSLISRCDHGDEHEDIVDSCSGIFGFDYAKEDVTQMMARLQENDE